jgi:HEAT repeat protein
VDVLGIISVPNSVPDIAQALPRVRAFKALAKIGNKQALDAIVPALHAWYLKGEYDQHYWQNKDTDDVEIDSFIRETFSSFEEEGRIALEAALATETFEGKYVIARALAVIGDDKSIPVLASTLETGDFLTKTEAAKALRRLNGTIEVMPKIINELNKTTDSWMAARKTDYYDSDEFRGADDACKVFADIILTSGSIDDWVKIAFHRPRDGRYDNNAESFDKALIDSKEQAVPALAKLLSDPDASVQAAAAEMIAEIKRSNDNSGNDSRKRY